MCGLKASVEFFDNVAVNHKETANSMILFLVELT